jgi:O-antigen/teichoic acid export membrane protein
VSDTGSDPAVPAPISTGAARQGDDATRRRRAEVGPGGLRRRVARGTIINSLYLVAINALTVFQGLLIARLLGATEYGLWGLLIVVFATLSFLAAIGFNDKYIQQDHPDQQVAFEIAFTLQALLAGIFTIIAFIAVPLFALLYAQPQILVPGLVIACAMPLIALQTPAWVFYRRLDFGRTRLLQGITPVVTFLVAVPMAIGGFGFWSLVVGNLAGAVAAAATAIVVSPYKLRFRYERGALREYTSFSWPLLVGAVGAVVTFQVPITLAARELGTAAVGAIALASQITQYTRRVDDVVTHALYPAICAVKDQRDLLFESFSKSNRLAVLWGFPTGVAAALFADNLVQVILGDTWKLAVPLLAVLGLSAAIDQIGFNWTAFARARGETRILAVQSALVFVAVLGVGVPLLILDGLPGYAVGIAAGTLTGLAVRLVYLRRLFPSFGLINHVGGAIAPTLLAAAVVLAGRALVPGAGGAARSIVEIAGYTLIVVITTWATERVLLREAIGYVRTAADRAPATSS